VSNVELFTTQSRSKQLGIRINSGRFITSPPNCPEWLNPFQKQEWQNHGLLWDATHLVVTHLCKVCTHDSYHMQETDFWITSGFIVDSPTNQIPIPNTRRKQPEVTDRKLPKEGWVLTNKIELTPDKASEFLAFLTSEKETLKQIATDEDRDEREALRKVYGLIVEYGGKIREEGKEVGTIVEPHKMKIILTSLQKGKYFTVAQATEVCSQTSRLIREWIRRGEIKAIVLPRLGMIIEAGKLNQFLNEMRFRS